MIVVPNPLPFPMPGGGPHSGYQFIFNKHYYKTRIDALKPFSYGFAASEFSTWKALTFEELENLANKLYDQTAPGVAGFGKLHVDFDEQIDFWQWDPYAIMYQRSQIYGYERVPIGTGTTSQPPNVVNPALLHGVPQKGKYLLVTCDANLL